MFHWRVCVCLFSDLDRDFWNNNDSSSVQQRWSSYPPKEFVLNISPYAPYGDPRLSLKWVSVQAGKRHQPLTPQPIPHPEPPRTLTDRTLDLCCSRKSGPLSFVCYFLLRKRPSDWHMLWTDQSLFVLLLLFCQKIILMVDKMQVAFYFNIQNRTRSKTEWSFGSLFH